VLPLERIVQQLGLFSLYYLKNAKVPKLTKALENNKAKGLTNVN
jgi:hypothetical protein